MGLIFGFVLIGVVLCGVSVGMMLLFVVYVVGVVILFGVVFVIGGKVFVVMKCLFGVGEWIWCGIGVVLLVGVGVIVFGFDIGVLV